MFDLRTLGGDALDGEAFAARAERDLLDQQARFIDAVTDAWSSSVPVDDGRLRGSLRPYRGAIPLDETPDSGTVTDLRESGAAFLGDTPARGSFGCASTLAYASRVAHRSGAFDHVVDALLRELAHST